MKTNELIGAQLDWAVAKCEGIVLHHAIQPHGYLEILFNETNGGDVFTPSNDWAQGGPIIEREGLNLNYTTMIQSAWSATSMNDLQEFGEYGPTPLIAAMRCYVASKLGDEVDVPEGLR